jgi:hypothetical protein
MITRFILERLHLLEDEAAHGKRSHRQRWLGSLADKQRNAHRDLSLVGVSRKHALHTQFLRCDAGSLRDLNR